MNLPDARDWLYSGKAFAAAALALYIALSLSLPNPYWCVATVYVVSHPLSGSTRSKAVYRVLGTLIGACGAVALVPAFVNTPIVLSLLISGWVGVFLYLALLDRTPRSYVFMLATYSLPLIALPTLTNPETVFDVALARSEEIVLGIICASLVNTTLFPRRVASVLNPQIDRLLGDAAEWARACLQAGWNQASIPHPPFLADIASMDALTRHLAYDTTHHRQAVLAQEIRLCAAMLIPQVSALLDPLAALASGPAQNESRDVFELVSEVTAWMRRDQIGTAGGEHLLAECGRQLALADNARGEVSAIRALALTRLDELLRLWLDCLELRAAIVDAVVTRSSPAFRLRRRLVHEPHYDHGLLLFAAGSAALATAAASLIWISSGSVIGAGGVMLVSVSCAFFAASDSPAPQISRFLFWEYIVLATALIYMFAILPGIETFEILLLALAPPLLIAGAFTNQPQHNVSVLLFTSGSISAITLNNGYAGDFESFTSNAIASIVGLVFALTWTLVTRPFGTEFAARRLAKANHHDLCLMASKLADDGRQVIQARLLDRLGQLLPRQCLLADGHGLDAIRDVRVGLVLSEIQTLKRQLPADLRQGVDAMMNRVRSFFDEPGDEHEAPSSLSVECRGLARALLDSRGPHEFLAAQAVIGLRLAFLPERPTDPEISPEPPQPQASALPIAVP